MVSSHAGMPTVYKGVKKKNRGYTVVYRGLGIRATLYIEVYSL